MEPRMQAPPARPALHPAVRPLCLVAGAPPFWGPAPRARLLARMTAARPPAAARARAAPRPRAAPRAPAAARAPAAPRARAALPRQAARQARAWPAAAAARTR